MSMDLEHQDIRWRQRFENYQKALVHLNDAVALSKERELTNLEKQGLMKVQHKQGLLGPKIELIPTEKGFKRFYS